jgi:hypothetical protein
MTKGAFGQKQGEGALAIAWPKEEGSDFAGHRMAKKSGPYMAKGSHTHPRCDRLGRGATGATGATGYAIHLAHT